MRTCHDTFSSRYTEIARYIAVAAGFAGRDVAQRLQDFLFERPTTDVVIDHARRRIFVDEGDNLVEFVF